MAVKKKADPTFTVSISYVVYSTPAKVFDALTQESQIAQWCDGGGHVDAEIDGTMELFGGWVKGTVVEFNKRSRKLSYTWRPTEWDKKVPHSLVSYSFNQHPAGTEILVEHSGFPSQVEADKHRSGWVDHVFEPLNDFFTS
jgi:uncharacterized protein YndB with AHSA1/START domain